jgi:hypothetical protein
LEHALTLFEAVEIHADGDLTFEQCMQVVPVIAAEYDMTCSYLEEWIDYLARHAGRECPPWPGQTFHPPRC